MPSPWGAGDAGGHTRPTAALPPHTCHSPGQLLASSPWLCRSPRLSSSSLHPVQPGVPQLQGLRSKALPTRARSGRLEPSSPVYAMSPALQPCAPHASPPPTSPPSPWFPRVMGVSRAGQAHTPLHSAQPQLSPLLCSCCHCFQSSPGP